MNGYAADLADRDPEYGVEPINSRESRLMNARILGVHERLPMLRIRDLEGDEYFVPLSAVPDDCAPPTAGRESREEKR